MSRNPTLLSQERKKGLDPYQGYWIYGEYLDNEILKLLKCLKMDDVEFIRDPEILRSIISDFINTSEDNSYKIILYRPKPNAHIQSIFLSKNQSEVDIFVFDSLKYESKKILKEYGMEIYNNLQDTTITPNVFFTHNQRQATQTGCVGFTLSDIAIMRNNPNFVINIKKDGLTIEGDKFDLFLLPPEFMLPTQFISKVSGYIDLLNATKVSKSRIEIFKKEMKPYTTPKYEEVPVATISRTKAAHDLSSLIDSKKEDKKSGMQTSQQTPKQETVMRRVNVQNDRNDQYLFSLAGTLKESNAKTSPSSQIKSPTSNKLQKKEIGTINSYSAS